jgi:TM2 domain-containing membrane protein YozV
MAQSTIPLRNPYNAAFLAWICPGLGHFYQGRTGKGWLYASCILSLYFVGFAMGEGKVVYWRWVSPFTNPEHFSIYYIGQFFVGLPEHLNPGTSILWGFMRPPDPNVMNGLHLRLGKLVEVGTIYTTVAGLLNVLAIYDAYEGPAYADSDEEPAPQSNSEGMPDLSGLKAEAQS